MKTTQITRFIHELPMPQHYNDWLTVSSNINLVNIDKPEGEKIIPPRPPRGPRCGVMVAKVVDESHYVIGVSLANPGLMKKHRGKTQRVGYDIFDGPAGIDLALMKIEDGANLPRVCMSTATTHRARNIQKQFDEFLLQAAKIFKDKTRRSAPPFNAEGSLTAEAHHVSAQEV